MQYDIGGFKEEVPQRQLIACWYIAPILFQDPTTAYYVISWDLYKPISPSIVMLPVESDEGSQSPTASASPEASMSRNDGSGGLLLGVEYEHAYEQLRAELVKAELVWSNRRRRPEILEQKPAKFVCQFRPITGGGLSRTTSTQKMPVQQVYWYRNGNPVHAPPFHVDHSLVTSKGISILSARAYPNRETLHDFISHEENAKTAVMENITCEVISRIKETPNFNDVSKVT